MSDVPHDRDPEASAMGGGGRGGHLSQPREQRLPRGAQSCRKTGDQRLEKR